jgi:hypothetical protein
MRAKRVATYVPGGKALRPILPLKETLFRPAREPRTSAAIVYFVQRLRRALWLVRGTHAPPTTRPADGSSASSSVVQPPLPVFDCSPPQPAINARRPASEALKRADTAMKKPAASYSPRPFRAKYHRR